jgi:hypothetical protein
MPSLVIYFIGALALAAVALRGLIHGVAHHLESDDR